MTRSFKADSEPTLSALTFAAEEFASQRDWAQFHDPKNLAMALAAETGELLSILRWVRTDHADTFSAKKENRDALADEIGDIGICLLLLCARTGITLDEAVTAKLSKNAKKYPQELSRGKANPPEAT